MKQAISIIVVLFVIAALFIINLPPRTISLKDIQPAMYPDKNEVDSTILEATPDETPEKNVDDSATIDYYIIIESSRNPAMAHQKAEKLKNEFQANIIVLPPTKEGYYRISYEKYSSLEEARSAIESIRIKIRPDVWIYTVKK